MFIDQSFDLIVRQIVYLSDLLSGRNILAQHDIQQSQFTVDLRADIQMFLAFMNQSNIFTHIRQTSFHFVHLDRTGDRILTQTFHNQVIFLTCQLKIFFCFQEFFLCNQVFLIQLFLLVISTTVACHVDIQLCFFQLIVQFVLFHRHLCITKKVLLFRQLCLSIQDLQVEI